MRVHGFSLKPSTRRVAQDIGMLWANPVMEFVKFQVPETRAGNENRIDGPGKQHDPMITGRRRNQTEPTEHPNRLTRQRTYACW